MSMVKVRNIITLSERVLGSHILNLCSRFYLQRTFVTGKKLCVRRIRSPVVKTYDEDMYNETSDPRDLGKVICLDPDEVEALDGFKPEHVKTKIKVKTKKTERKSNINFQNNGVEVAGSLTNDNSFERNQTDEYSGKTLKKSGSTWKTASNLLCKLMTNLKTKKQREKNQKIILEGKRLINDAVLAGMVPLMIFYSRSGDIEKLNLPKNVTLHKTSYKNLKLWSDVITSQGLIGIFVKPSSALSKPKTALMPLIVIIDNIREPGNLGSLLRIVASVGCEAILTKGCVDLWEPKVLRSGAGAHFRLPFLKYGLIWEEIEKELPDSCRFLLADNKPAQVTNESENSTEIKESDEFPCHLYHQLDYTEGKTVVVIGGESHGLSQKACEVARRRKGAKVCIPMYNEMESLNTAVAFGILAYEIKRQIGPAMKTSPREKYSDGHDFDDRNDVIVSDAVDAVDEKSMVGEKSI